MIAPDSISFPGLLLEFETEGPGNTFSELWSMMTSLVRHMLLSNHSNEPVLFSVHLENGIPTDMQILPTDLFILLRPN